MAAKQSWYFDGYIGRMVPKKNGKGYKRELVYVGEKYGFEQKETLRRRKIESAVLTAISLGANLFAQLFGGYSELFAVVRAFAMLSLFPLMFDLIGLGNFLFAGPKWKVRTYYAGYRRMKRWGIGYLAVMIVWLIAEIVFLCFNTILFRAELPYLIAVVISTAAQAAEVALILKNPAYVIERPQ